MVAVEHVFRRLGEGVAFLLREVQSGVDEVVDDIDGHHDDQRGSQFEPVGAFEVLAFVPSIPLAALQDDACGHEEKCRDTEEVEQVAGVDDTAADALVVLFQSKAFDEEVSAAFQQVHP